ncbi:MAG: hypothetical protein MJZ00_07190 [Paludibacteraceae bacterium]|nr:hypothetical protein [Paludibacteraceae bacterium]
MALNVNYEAARTKAIAFLKSKNQNFNEAIGILEMAEFKPIYVAKIKKAGENPDTHKGLMTTLCQMIRAWAAPTSVEMMDEMTPAANVASNISEEQIKKMDVIFSDSETPAGMLIRHFSTLYKTRAKLHREMADVGEKNDDESISKRKTLVVSISAISEKMDAIWPYIDAYETRHEQPSLELVEDIINGVTKNSDFSSYGMPREGELKALEQPVDNFDTWTREELVAERKNITARIRRTKNKIEYQAEAVAGRKPNPLPQGSPKRAKLENRIKNLEKILYRLDMKIAEFG